MFRFLGFVLLLAALAAGPAVPASAQQGTSGGSSSSASGGQEKDSLAQQKDMLHLNTIGAFSAGFVLQSYGYIGVLADALSKGVYAPDLVRSMLSETISYLRNVNTQLKQYQNNTLVSASDRKFMVSMIEIVDLLIEEASALSSFAQSKNADDLKRFEEARKNAWKNIKKTFGMN